MSTGEGEGGGGARDDRHSSHGKYLVGGECAKSKVW